MANLAAMYQNGFAGRRNYGAAYAWLRVALELDLRDEDRDLTIFRLGMLASRLGPAKAQVAELRAQDLADEISGQCGTPTKIVRWCADRRDSSANLYADISAMSAAP
jgi:TPR repeat protein